MASSLPEQNKWEPSVYQLEKDTPVLGGPGGPDNMQAQQLANRTLYLKSIVDGLQSGDTPYSSLEKAIDAIAAGIIPEGSKFSVRSDNPDYWMEEYVNQAGTPVKTGKFLLDGSAITKLITFDDNGNAILINDVDEQSLIVIGDSAGVHLTGMDGSVQERLGAIGKDRAPFILTLSDVEKLAIGVINDFGHLNLPHLPDSVQNMLNSHRRRIEKIINNRRYLDIRECGYYPGRGENALHAIQLAINTLYAAGGGVLYLPEGIYPLSSHIVPRSGVAVIGAGMGKTVLMPYKANAAFRYIGKNGNTITYLDNCVFSDFTIDGINQVLPSNGVYIPDIKGMFFQYYSNTIIDRVEIKNTGATGLGLDFPDNVWINRVRTQNCGRLGTDTGTGEPADINTPILRRPLGASGIGLGTGAKDVEVIFVSETVNISNMNFGIFFEPQLAGAAKGAVCVNNVCIGNFAGIADCGIDGLLTAGNVMDSNKYGFLLYPGTNLGGKPGRRGLVTNNLICNSLSHGVYSYSQKTDPLLGEYQFVSNKIRGNAEDGINHRYTSPAVKISSIVIHGNDIYENGRHGIHFEAGNIAINTDITNNRIWANGKLSSGNAININVPMLGCSITSNKLRDILQFDSEGQPAPTQQYPVNVSAALTDTDISFNHCVGNAANTFNLTGTQTRVTTFSNAGIQ
ncbi:glycosyl hydrolase family 28-related protein [Serratia sp. Nf2]|uniref:glycosyl hydrolase family 28-related protein n=1 Tax=Serratia sp. Nf2 TaxID=2116540 RepID=UPI000D15FF4C|nr:glycosyl hydrolase family 28-related protein [Serratia sp. Nf2]PTA74969.1 hypothetical protein C9411_20990 [Serratia sp. Nf2]